MPYNEVDRSTIEEMVHKFYTRVLKDDILSPFFIRALGDDLKNHQWYEHLNTLNNFWLMMMLGEKNYWGSPFPPHAFIGPLSDETYERWLKLFSEITHELFTEELAEKFYKKAAILAEQFKVNLSDDDDDD